MIGHHPKCYSSVSIRPPRGTSVEVVTLSPLLNLYNFLLPVSFSFRSQPSPKQAWPDTSDSSQGSQQSSSTLPVLLLRGLCCGTCLFSWAPLQGHGYLPLISPAPSPSFHDLQHACPDAVFYPTLRRCPFPASR